MDYAIEISNITFKYEKGKTVFENFSLSVKDNEFLSVIGKNGSGKTTLAKLVMGILKPQSGTIKIFGREAADMTIGQRGELIGYAYQNPDRQLFAVSVLEELTFTLEMKGISKQDAYKSAEEMIELFQLDKVRDTYPFLLSYGEKRRLALAAVLINKPKYLLLDEPTSSLDREKINILSQILFKLREQNIGIMAISHDEDFVRKHSDRVVEIQEGRLVSDEILQN